MNFINSYMVSLCAWTAILVNGLVFFRFNPFRYWKEILMISIFTASVSLILQHYNRIELITLVPPLFAIIFFVLITGFSWMHALTMIVIGLTISGFLEFGVTYFFSDFDIDLTLKSLSDDYSLQAWYFVGLHFLLSLYLYKRRLGFTTINKNQRRRLDNKLLVFIFIFFFSNSIAGILIVFKEPYFLFIVLFIFLLFITCWIYNYVRELKDDH